MAGPTVLKHFGFVEIDATRRLMNYLHDMLSSHGQFPAKHESPAFLATELQGALELMALIRRYSVEVHLWSLLRGVAPSVKARGGTDEQIATASNRLNSLAPPVVLFQPLCHVEQYTVYLSEIHEAHSERLGDTIRNHLQIVSFPAFHSCLISDHQSSVSWRVWQVDFNVP